MQCTTVNHIRFLGLNFGSIRNPNAAEQPKVRNALKGAGEKDVPYLWDARDSERVVGSFHHQVDRMVPELMLLARKRLFPPPKPVDDESTLTSFCQDGSVRGNSSRRRQLANSRLSGMDPLVRLSFIPGPLSAHVDELVSAPSLSDISRLTTSKPESVKPGNEVLSLIDDFFKQRVAKKENPSSSKSSKALVATSSAPPHELMATQPGLSSFQQEALQNVAVSLLQEVSPLGPVQGPNVTDSTSQKWTWVHGGGFHCVQKERAEDTTVIELLKDSRRVPEVVNHEANMLPSKLPGNATLDDLKSEIEEQLVKAVLERVSKLYPSADSTKSRFSEIISEFEKSMLFTVAVPIQAIEVGVFAMSQYHDKLERESMHYFLSQLIETSLQVSLIDGSLESRMEKTLTLSKFKSRNVFCETMGTILPVCNVCVVTKESLSNPKLANISVRLQLSSDLQTLSRTLLSKKTIEDVARVKQVAVSKDFSYWSAQKEVPPQGFGLLVPWRQDVTIKASAFDNIAYFSHEKPSNSPRGFVSIAEKREQDYNLSEDKKRETLQLILKVFGGGGCRRIHVSGDADFFTVAFCPALALTFRRRIREVPKAVAETSLAVQRQWPWLPSSIHIGVYELLLLRRGLPMGFVLAELKEDLEILREYQFVNTMTGTLFKDGLLKESKPSWDDCYSTAEQLFRKHVLHVLPSIEITCASTSDPRSVSCQLVRIQGASLDVILSWLAERGASSKSYCHEDRALLRRFFQMNDLRPPPELLAEPMETASEEASQAFLARILKLPTELCPPADSPNGVLVTGTQQSDLLSMLSVSIDSKAKAGGVFGGRVFHMGGTSAEEGQHLGLEMGLSLSQRSKLQGGGALLRSKVRGRLYLIRKYSDLARAANDDAFWEAHYFTLCGMSGGGFVPNPKLLESKEVFVPTPPSSSSPRLSQVLSHTRAEVQRVSKELSHKYSLRPSHIKGFHISTTLRQIPPSHVRRVLPAMQLSCGTIQAAVQVPKSQCALAAAIHSTTQRPAVEEGTGFINYFGLNKFSHYSLRNQHVGLHLLKGEFKTAAAILMDSTEEGFKGSLESFAERSTRTAKERREFAKEMDGVAAASATSAGGGRLGSIIRRALRSESSSRRVIRKLSKDSAPLPQQTSPGFENALAGLETLPEGSMKTSSSAQGIGLEFVTEEFMKDIFLEFVGIKACLLLIQEFLSFVWNEMVSIRIRQYGPRAILPGDLVVDATVDSASLEHDLKSPRLRPTYASMEDIICGKYTYRDVVMPLPGYFVALPDHEGLANMITNCLRKGYGIDLDAESERWELFGKGFGWFERFLTLGKGRDVKDFESIQTKEMTEASLSASGSRGGNAMGLVIAGGYRRVYEGPISLTPDDVTPLPEVQCLKPPAFFAQLVLSPDDSHVGELEHVRLLRKEGERLLKLKDVQRPAHKSPKRRKFSQAVKHSNNKSLARKHFAAAAIAEACIPAKAVVELRLPVSAYPSCLWREVTKLQRNSWEDVAELRAFLASKEPNVDRGSSDDPLAPAVKNDPKKFEIAKRLNGLRVEDLNARDRYLYETYLSKSAPHGRKSTQGSYAMYSAVLHRTLFRGGSNPSTDLLPHAVQFKGPSRPPPASYY